MKKSLSLLLIFCTLIFCLASCKSEPEPEPPHVHEWSAWQTEKAATVLSDGVRYRTCECGERSTQTISKSGAKSALSGKWYIATGGTSYVYIYFYANYFKMGVGVISSEYESKNPDPTSGAELSVRSGTYKVDGTRLTLTDSEDGTVLSYTLQDMGTTLKVFESDNDEYIHVN